MKIASNLSRNKKKLSYFQTCINTIVKCIPRVDWQNIERVVIMEERKNEIYNDAGGMYYIERNGTPAYIELYLKQLIDKTPKFIPKMGIFFNYTIMNLLIHEIGHHVHKKYAFDRDSDGWEMSADQYAYQYLWKIYGLWMYIFLTLGSINNIFKQK